MNEEDREAAKHLVGYCENCQVWTHFEVENRDKGCEVCGGKFSSKHGHQITTERTFRSVSTKKLTKRDSVA